MQHFYEVKFFLNLRFIHFGISLEGPYLSQDNTNIQLAFLVFIVLLQVFQYFILFLSTFVF